MNPSYSQGGEDLACVLALKAIGVNPSQVRYLDIGAGHPVENSNTYLLHTMGARGVLVEPNADLTSHWMCRDGDTVIAKGVGPEDKPGEPYFLASNPTHNSFVRPKPGNNWVPVPLVGINTLLAEHFPDAAPDFVSIDAEGMDFDIIRAWDFTRWRPAVMCVEMTAFGSRQWDWAIRDLMALRGYSLRGGSFYNGVFVDEDRLRASHAD